MRCGRHLQCPSLHRHIASWAGRLLFLSTPLHLRQPELRDVVCYSWPLSSDSHSSSSQNHRWSAFGLLGKLVSVSFFCLSFPMCKMARTLLQGPQSKLIRITPVTGLRRTSAAALDLNVSQLLHAFWNTHKCLCELVQTGGTSCYPAQIMSLWRSRLEPIASPVDNPQTFCSQLYPVQATPMCGSQTSYPIYH